MNTIREIFDNEWIRQGLICTDDRKEAYFQRAMKIPALRIGEVLHFCLIFPESTNDYQINYTATVKQ